MVKVDELHPGGKRSKPRFHPGVIDSWAAMYDERSRPLAHARTVGHETRAVDVEEDFRVS
jgi:hypothetical protein